jgi:large subunit ribosomal protein L32
MAVPRNRMSNAKRKSKQAHHAKVKRNPVSCTSCGAFMLPHVACSSCGWYNNREVVQMKERSGESE